MLKPFKHLLSNLLIRILSRIQTKRASLIDIYFCYRLFLKRKADPEGWQTSSRKVKEGMTLDQLTSMFIDSQEFSGREVKPSPLHIYSGYTTEDVAMLQSYTVQKAVIGNEFFTDGFSQVTLFKSVPFCNNFNVERLSLPVPDDGFHAETLEYFAVCDSIHRSGENYCIAELGAGWGPWISLGGVIARNHKIRNITLIGVEADPERFALMKDQLISNNLFPDISQDTAEMNGIRCRLFQGAVWPTHKTLWFPKTDIREMGAAALEQGTDRDYCGQILEKINVEGITLKEILDNNIVDLLHIDIQGTEYEVIRSSIDIVNSQVKSMMIGTHSRTIEGELIKLLYEHGWYLHREKPCRVEWRKSPASLEAMTGVDGCQYWRR